MHTKFGDTRIAKIGCTPKEYYAKLSTQELVATLKAHLEQVVPVPEFLCAELETRNDPAALLPLLETEDTETASYAINLIADDARAFATYFSILEDLRFDEEIRSDVTDLLRLHADEVQEQAFALYEKDGVKEYALEILSRVKVRSERVYEKLLSAFLDAEDTSRTAGYLAAYGDERALKPLLKKIEDRSIGFVEFQE